MSEGILGKKGGDEFGTGALKKATERAMKEKAPRSAVGSGWRGARGKESSNNDRFETLFARMSAEKKLTGAMVLNYLNDMGGRRASPEAIEKVMNLARQKLDKGIFNRLENIVSPGRVNQSEARTTTPVPEQKPASEESLGERVLNSEEKREREESESPKPLEQESAVEPQATPAVEAETSAPEEGLDAAQRVAQRLAAEIPDSEATRAEWVKKLRELVEETKVNLTEGTERLKGYLTNRSEELDAKVQEQGIVERYFRSLGEAYDKLGWKSKLAVGLSLGLGAGFLSAVSLPGAVACLSGIAVQRVAGLSSAFLKYEKNAQDDKWGKEKAMGKAIGQAALMTGGMLLLVGELKEDIAYWKEQHLVGVAQEWLKQEWLKHHWPFGHTEGTVIPAEDDLVSKDEAEAQTREVLAAEERMATTVEMPSVEASSGHGYEYMAKRLWEQLQDKGLDPSKYAEGSDIRRLLEADAQSIDKVVHQIAVDPAHGFFHESGESVRIDPGMRVTIGVDGQIHLLGTHGGDTVQAGAEAAVTPSYHPEAVSSTESLSKETDAHIVKLKEHLDDIKKTAAEQQDALGGKVADTGYESSAYPYGPAPMEDAPYGRDPVTGEPLSKSGAVGDAAPTRPQGELDILARNNKLRMLADMFARDKASELFPVEGLSPGEKDILNDSLRKLTPEELKTVDTYLQLMTPDAREEPGILDRILNWFSGASGEAPVPEASFEISATEAHIYATDSKELFVYGGPWEKQGPLIQQYLEAHPGDTVYSLDAAGKHRIPWSLVDGKVTPGTPVRTGGFFGLGSSWAEAPDPKEFTRMVPLEHAGPAAAAETPKVDTSATSFGKEAITPPAVEEATSGSKVQEPNGNSKAVTPSSSGSTIPSHETGNHPLGSIKFGSLEGKFNYSPSGAPESFSIKGMFADEGMLEAKKLLADNYKDMLSSDMIERAKASRAIELGAVKISSYKQALEELVKKGSGRSPEADFLKNSIKSIIKGTEDIYGKVFKGTDITH